MEPSRQIRKAAGRLGAEFGARVCHRESDMPDFGRSGHEACQGELGVSRV
jgi:hypothetical protein